MPELSKRFQALPKYALSDVPRIKAELAERGVDVIDLGAGDADLMPPESVVKAMQQAVTAPGNSRYPFQRGLPEFRAAISGWMKRRFDVTVDPEKGLLPLIGTKEGIAKLPLCYLDPGDAGIVPDPGYYPYFGGTQMAGGEVIYVPLRRENDFLLDWEEVPEESLERAKILYLNYPNNPTGAIAPDEYFQEALEFCRKNDLLLVHDNAYSEISYNGYRPPSILQYEGASEVALEYQSLSKTYNMTGWRIGWVAGNTEAIASLSRLKTFYDTGVFLACQAAGVAALNAWEEFLPGQIETFQTRRDAAVESFRAAGFELEVPKATMYLWIAIPGREPSIEYTTRILEASGVVLFPGAGMGAGGEGFFRIALTQPPERLREAANRIAEVT